MTVRNFDVISLHRVVDGDTVDLDLDLGFKVFATVRVRLARVNCPERDIAAGKEATLATAEWLAIPGPLWIACKGHDMYGRWIAELYRGTENLSDYLLGKGFAVPYPHK